MLTKDRDDVLHTTEGSDLGRSSFKSMLPWEILSLPSDETGSFPFVGILDIVNIWSVNDEQLPVLSLVHIRIPFL
jgi:hypothetical protein